MPTHLVLAPTRRAFRQYTKLLGLARHEAVDVRRPTDVPVDAPDVQVHFLPSPLWREHKYMTRARQAALTKLEDQGFF